MIAPYENLANAIVIQAAKDYRKSLSRLSRNPKNSDALKRKRECERFFHSVWCRELTNIDPKYILETLKGEQVR